jgi:hypothetical protein
MKPIEIALRTEATAVYLRTYHNIAAVRKVVISIPIVITDFSYKFIRTFPIVYRTGHIEHGRVVTGVKETEKKPVCFV